MGPGKLKLYIYIYPLVSGFALPSKHTWWYYFGLSNNQPGGKMILKCNEKTISKLQFKLGIQCSK
jgi:hypothetical protein